MINLSKLFLINSTQKPLEAVADEQRDQNETSLFETSILQPTNDESRLVKKKPLAIASTKKDYLNTSGLMFPTLATAIPTTSHHRRKPSLEFVVSQSATAAVDKTTVASPSRTAFHFANQFVIDATPVKPRSLLLLTASGLYLSIYQSNF